jgi:hypothetical protein
MCYECDDDTGYPNWLPVPDPFALAKSYQTMPRPQFRLSTLLWITLAVAMIAAGDWFIFTHFLQDAWSFIRDRVIREDPWLIWVIGAWYAASVFVAVLVIWRGWRRRRIRQ